MAKIDDLKKRLESQKKLRSKFNDQGKDSLVKKFDKVIATIEKDIKTAEKAVEKVVKKAPKKAKKTSKPAKSKVVGSMSKDECIAELQVLRGQIKARDEANEEKNIKSGKAEADGSLKVSASLDNEVEIIANKADAGQVIIKKEQKTITLNIKNIVKECITMIKTQKDSETLLKDLIRQLNGLEADVRAGKLQYES